MGERPYRGVSAEDRRATRRSQLIDAGLELFGDGGYDATSVDAVCAAAGLTKRYFYEHFSDREDLLIAVFEQVTATVYEAAAEAAAAAPSELWARARAALDGFLDALVADPRRARIQLVEVVGRSPEVERRRREVLERFVDLVASIADEVLARPELDEVDLRLGTRGLVAATNELTADWVLGDLDVERERLVDYLMRLYRAAAALPPADLSEPGATRPRVHESDIDLKERGD